MYVCNYHMLRMLIVPVLQLSTDNDNKGDDSRDFLFIQVLTRAAQASPSTAAAVSAAAPAQHTSPNQGPPLPSPAPPASVCTGANMWLSSVSYLSTWNIFDELVELLAHFQGKWENWMLISQEDFLDLGYQEEELGKSIHYVFTADQWELFFTDSAGKRCY